MSLSKKKKFKKIGIRTKEALDLLYDIIDKDEGIYKQNCKEVFSLISEKLASTRKRTIHNRHTFENKAREIINKSKEKINNGDYLEVLEEILSLFWDEIKSKTRMFVERNAHYIGIALSVISIVVPVILKFT